MTVGVGEPARVDAERAHVRERGHRAPGRLGERELPVRLGPRASGDAGAEPGRAARAGRQSRVPGQVDALVPADQQPAVETEERDRPVRAGDLVVELPPDDPVGRPAQAIAVEGQRPTEVIGGQRDEHDLCCMYVSLLAGTGSVPERGRLRPEEDRQRPRSPGLADQEH